MLGNAHGNGQKIIMAEINWNTVPDGELLKWDVAPKVVEGVLISKKTQRDVGKGPGHIYEVQTKNGIVAFFAPTILHQKLERLPIPTCVRVTLTEISKTKTGNTLKLFKVDNAPVEEATLKIMGIELLKNDEETDDPVGGSF